MQKTKVTMGHAWQSDMAKETMGYLQQTNKVGLDSQIDSVVANVKGK